MSYSRRDTLLLGGALSMGLLAARKVDAQEAEIASPAPAPAATGDYTPVVTPNGATLPFKMRDGVKIFHLVAEPVDHTFAPGLEARCWGYNGRVHGPTIEAVEGDHIRIYVTNRLPAATTVHWHGMLVPSGMDGVGGLNQAPIHPGETYVYEFKLKHHGTFMYHSHHDEMTQMAMGLMGMIVVHPRKPEGPKPDREYVMMLSEWKIDPGTARPDTAEMSDFNVLTFNGKAFPGTEPLVARTGERVRIRFGNLSAMDNHPIHLHGFIFDVVEENGAPVRKALQKRGSTVLVPTGSTQAIEFIADEPGDWAMHCHMTHHVMNQMGHGIEVLIGADRSKLSKAIHSVLPGSPIMGHNGMADHGAHLEAGHITAPDNSIPMLGAHGPMGYITMGGMFTVLKVRNDYRSGDDPGWYGERDTGQAREADPEELRRDGIDV